MSISTYKTLSPALSKVILLFSNNRLLKLFLWVVLFGLFSIVLKRIHKLAFKSKDSAHSNAHSDGIEMIPNLIYAIDKNYSNFSVFPFLDASGARY